MKNIYKTTITFLLLLSVAVAYAKSDTRTFHLQLSETYWKTGYGTLQILSYLGLYNNSHGTPADIELRVDLLIKIILLTWFLDLLVLSR